MRTLLLFLGMTAVCSGVGGKRDSVAAMLAYGMYLQLTPEEQYDYDQRLILKNVDRWKAYEPCIAECPKAEYICRGIRDIEKDAPVKTQVDLRCDGGIYIYTTYDTYDWKYLADEPTLSGFLRGFLTIFSCCDFPYWGKVTVTQKSLAVYNSIDPLYDHNSSCNAEQDVDVALYEHCIKKFTETFLYKQKILKPTTYYVLAVSKILDAVICVLPQENKVYVVRPDGAEKRTKCSWLLCDVYRLFQ